MSDNTWTKVAQAVIRLIAFALVVVSCFLYADDLYLYLSHRPAPPSGRLAWKAIPFLIGLVLYWKSRALADRVTKDLD
jgi:hypothetical protein